MSEEEQALTIEDNLGVIEDTAKRLLGFIEGLEAAAVLQGLDKDDVYKIGRMYGATSNIRCYCLAIRELLEEQKKKNGNKTN